MLALAGGCYQGVFRNPLADPYLLGVAAGAGLGGHRGDRPRRRGRQRHARRAAGDRSAGRVRRRARRRHADLRARRGRRAAAVTGDADPGRGGGLRVPLRRCRPTSCNGTPTASSQVYSWLLGRLATAGWHDVLLVLPYAALTTVVVLLHRRELDVLAVGDDEATSLGLHPQRTRYLLIAAASLGTAAAVSASGLIGFVGIIVPHTVRLLAGSSYRVILPLSLLFGGAFLALTDVVARTAAAPSEMPIGVVTALAGRPVLRPRAADRPAGAHVSREPAAVAACRRGARAARRLGGTPILTGVDLTVAAGEWVTVIGPNGAGKSTLLRAVGGLLPAPGRSPSSVRRVRALRRRDRARMVATVAQSPVVPPGMSVLDYVLLGRTPYIPPLGRESTADLDAVHEVLGRLDLDRLPPSRTGHPLRRRTAAGVPRPRARPGRDAAAARRADQRARHRPPAGRARTRRPATPRARPDRAGHDARPLPGR